jgi:hypothetical protein
MQIDEYMATLADFMNLPLLELRPYTPLQTPHRRSALRA